MPTASAAFGCSPTARVRSPHFVRKSASWSAITMKRTLIAIGPWSRNITRIGPMSGRFATVRKVERDDDAGAAQPRACDDESVQLPSHAERADIHQRAGDDLIGSHRGREASVGNTG